MARRWGAFVVLLAAAACRHTPNAPVNVPAGPARPPMPPPGSSAGVPGALVPAPEHRDLDVEWGRVTVNVASDGGTVAGSAELVHPKLWVFRHPSTGERAAETGKEKAEAARPAGAPSPLENLEARLRQVVPADVDRVAVFNGEIVLVDMTQKNHPQLWLHDLAVSIENLATRRWLAEGRPVLVAMSGTVQGSGKLTVFVSADPFGKELNFAGRASLVGLQARELFEFIDAATALQAPVGTVDMFVEFSVQHGSIQGGIKPVIKNLVITPSGSLTAWKGLKTWLADAAVELTSNAVPGRNAISTVIPISGKIAEPNARLWPTLVGVLRNAFVEGLTSSFAQVPPRGGS